MARTPEVISAHNVQGIILWGYGHFPHAMFIMSRITEAAAFQKWLAARLAPAEFEEDPDFDHTTDPPITRAHRNPRGGRALNLAFTAEGLYKLFPAVHPEVLAVPELDDARSLLSMNFSYPFVHGMAVRGQELGDVHDSDPKKWRWSDCAREPEPVTRPSSSEARSVERKRLDPVHVLTLCYTERDGARWPPAGPWPPGTEEIDRRETHAWGSVRGRVVEHFGFTDALGDPGIRGWRRHQQGPRSEGNEVEPGEFLIGYPDQNDVHLGTRFERFSAGAAQLPGTPAPLSPLEAVMGSVETEEDEPTAPVGGGGSPEVVYAPNIDFRRDGSYLVVRQLEQNVHGFLKYLEDQAKKAHHAPADAPLTAEQARDMVNFASKMVGRWPNGASMSVARSLDEASAFESASRSELDNFDYASDGAGLGCPFGSHVRRVNPRDSVFAHSPSDPAERRSLVNRRRLIRRGRTYGSHAFEGNNLSDFLLPGPDRNAVGDLQGLLRRLELELELIDDDRWKGRGIFFLCFNTSIAQQFEHVQRTWINNPFFAGLSEDPDPITGPGEECHIQKASFTIPAVNGRKRLQGITRYVTVRAGGYFFMPSLESLGTLATPREPITTTGASARTRL